MIAADIPNKFCKNELNATQHSVSILIMQNYF